MVASLRHTDCFALLRHSSFDSSSWMGKIDTLEAPEGSYQDKARRSAQGPNEYIVAESGRKAG